MIQVERAQRSVLKTMLSKPYRYPTNNVYSESGVLSVRQLFIVKVCLDEHKRVINDVNYNEMLRRRIFKTQTVCVNTSFAQRFSPFLTASLYNKVVNLCDFKNSSMFEAKAKLTKWLKSLDYDSSEVLLSSLK